MFHKISAINCNLCYISYPIISNNLRIYRSWSICIFCLPKRPFLMNIEILNQNEQQKRQPLHAGESADTGKIQL